MSSYPAPALALVEQMAAAAAADPARAVSFQGAPGANSHIAALRHDPDCLPMPCWSFADAIDADQQIALSSQVWIIIDMVADGVQGLGNLLFDTLKHRAN